MQVINQLLGGTILLIIHQIQAATGSCEVYIKSVSYPDKYWHAFNETTVVLSSEDKTLWQIKSPSMFGVTASLTFKVINSSSTETNDFYLCVINEIDIRLCKKDVENKWPRSFEFTDKRDKAKATFQARSLNTAVLNEILHAGDNIDSTKAKMDLVFDKQNINTTWEVEINQGCYGLFQSLTTTAVTTTLTTTMPTTTTTLPTTSSTTTTSPTTTSTTTENTTTATSPTTAAQETTLIPSCIINEESTSQDSVKENDCRRRTENSLKDEVMVKLNGLDTKLKSISLSTNSSSTSSSETSKATMNFAIEMENFVLDIADQMKITGSIQIQNDAVDMKCGKEKLPLKLDVAGNSITASSDTFNNDPITYSAIQYLKLHENIKNKLHVRSMNSVDDHSKKDYTINSKMIAAIVKEQHVVNSVNIGMIHLNKVSSENTVCAFWNKSDGGFWSRDGCIKLTTLSNDTFTSCSCNHLTNFAILTAIDGYEIPEEHAAILSTLTLVCCCISITFLFIGIVLFIVLLSGEKRHSRHIIHFNLMIALFISQILFVTGIEAVVNETACTGIAMMLHYFLLASFGWMLMEGLFLYFSVIKVFTDGKSNLLYFFLFAWGFPVVIVIATGSADINHYGSDKYCWLTGHAIWSFVVPIIAIIIVNTVILVLLIKQIVQLSKTDGVLDEAKIGLRSSLILMPLLGITWIFGVLTFHSNLIVFQYIFAITNSLQGFVLTLLHCLLNGDVRKALKRKAEVWGNSSSIGGYIFYSRNKLRFDDSQYSNSVFKTNSNHLLSSHGSNGHYYSKGDFSQVSSPPVRVSRVNNPVVGGDGVGVKQWKYPNV